jgi:ribokinase
MNTPPAIVVVGSLNVDWVVTVPRFPRAGETVCGESLVTHPGGKGGNQAAAAARIGAGRVAVRMVGQVGGEAQGSWLVRGLSDAGVDVSAVAIDPTVASGTALVVVDRQAQNQIIIVAGANGTFESERFATMAGALDAADLVLLQLEIPLETVEAAARAAHHRHACVVLDPAPARCLDAALLGLCDYVTPNESELRVLLGENPAEMLTIDGARDGAKRLRARGARNVVVKMGMSGALLVGQAGEIHWPAVHVTAVDSTAAGDVWNGAFAVALAERLGVEAAGAFANAAAALAVTRPGAQPSIPARAEVDALLHGARTRGPSANPTRTSRRAPI